MIAPHGQLRVYVATRPVDFRKGMDGLALVVQEVLGLDPFSGAAFVFRSKRADRIKVLIWDRTGLVLVHKRLEGCKFVWPRRGRFGAARYRAGPTACPGHSAPALCLPSLLGCGCSGPCTRTRGSGWIADRSSDRPGHRFQIRRSSPLLPPSRHISTGQRWAIGWGEPASISSRSSNICAPISETPIACSWTRPARRPLILDEDEPEPAISGPSCVMIVVTAPPVRPL